MRRDALVVLVFLLLAFAAAMQLSAGNAGDKNWLLLAAAKWRDGRTLYVDIFEVNPPLIVWLYALIERMSAGVPFLQDYQFLALSGLMACTFSAGMAAYLLGFHPAFKSEPDKGTYLALLLLVIFVFFTGPGSFFDREHILLVMTFPYLLRFLPALEGAAIPLRTRLLIGAMAALGFCIKPHGMVIFAAVSLMTLLRGRNLNLLFGIENLLVSVAALFYLAAIFTFTPDYIHTIVPMALATYSAFSRRLIGLFYAIFALVIGGVSLADFRPRDTSPYRRDIYYLLGVCMAFFLYAEVNNGWGYTFQPLINLELFLCGWLFIEHGWLKRDARLKGLPVKRFEFGQRACAGIVLCYATYGIYAMGVFFLTPACERLPDCVNNLPYVRYVQNHHARTFGALSEDFHKWPELARLSGARFETRYNALWMLPKLVEEEKHPRAAHRWIVESVGQGLAWDMEVRKPDIMFVEDDENFFGLNTKIDIIAFFSQVEAFRRAWAHYHYDATIDRCFMEGKNGISSQMGCRYAIYRYEP